jgi:hypothetical protein
MRIELNRTYAMVESNYPKSIAIDSELAETFAQTGIGLWALPTLHLLSLTYIYWQQTTTIKKLC